MHAQTHTHTPEPDLTAIIDGRKHVLHDVRDIPQWHPVQAVESIYGRDGELATVVNHLDYATAAARYEVKVQA